MRKAGDEMRDEYVKIKDVCKELGVTKVTFWSWTKKGYIKPDYVTPGGQRKFKQSTIDRFREERREAYEKKNSSITINNDDDYASDN